MTFDPASQAHVRAKIEQMIAEVDEEAARKKLDPWDAYDLQVERENELAAAFDIDPYLFGKIVTRVLLRAPDIFQGVLYP